MSIKQGLSSKSFHLIDKQEPLECYRNAPPGGPRSDGTPKIIIPLITHNTTQFKKSKSAENIVAFSSILLSTFYVAWLCGWLKKSDVLFLVFRQTVHPLVPPITLDSTLSNKALLRKQKGVE
jgi:hypothetical protein